MTNTANDEAAKERMVQYVLGELPRAEAEAFEAHLAADAALRAEVDRLRGALGLLAFASVNERTTFGSWSSWVTSRWSASSERTR